MIYNTTGPGVTISTRAAGMKRGRLAIGKGRSIASPLLSGVMIAQIWDQDWRKKDVLCNPVALLLRLNLYRPCSSNTSPFAIISVIPEELYQSMIRVNVAAAIVRENQILAIEYDDESGLNYNLPGGG